MDWLNAQSLNNLKKYKTLTKLKSEVNNDIKKLFHDKTFKDKNTIEIINIKSASWKGMYDKIVTFRAIINELNSNDGVATNNSVTNYNGVFKSQVDEYILLLAKVSADKQNNSHSGTLTRIKNVWISFAHVDGTGVLWINSSRLADILRTNESNAKYKLKDTPDRSKQLTNVSCKHPGGIIKSLS